MEVHESPALAFENRYAALTQKVAALAADPLNAPKMTLGEVREFLQTWESSSCAADDEWVSEVARRLNRGDTDILWK